MATALWSLLAGAIFGLALAAPPGPMNAVIAEESVRNGWTAGVRAGLGAMAADATFFVLALLGLVGIVQRAPTVRAVMIAIGGGLMLYFAYGAAQGALTVAAVPVAEMRSDEPSEHRGDEANERRSDEPSEQRNGGPRSSRTDRDRGFRKAFALAITNPYQLVFWLTVGVRLLEPGTVDVLTRVPGVDADLAGRLIVETGSPALVVGLFAGIAVWIVTFPAALVNARRRLESAATIIAATSAAILAGYGVLFLADAATTLFG